MGFVKGVKYQYQARNNGIFVESDGVTEMPATGVYFQCKDVRVPFIYGVIMPGDGTWCECVGDVPITLISNNLSYYGERELSDVEIGYLRDKLIPYYGVLHDSELICIRKALCCMMPYVDENTCKDIREELCQYLMLDWDEYYSQNGFDRNTYELTYTVHTILFGYKIANFVKVLKSNLSEMLISANVGSDNKIHMLLDGRDVEEMYRAVTTNESSIKDLLNAAAGNKGTSSTYADMFWQWFLELSYENKEVVKNLDSHAYVYACNADTRTLLRTHDYDGIKKLMYDVYVIIRSVTDEQQMFFMDEMYEEYGPDDWRLVKERDSELYHAVCNGINLDPTLYNKMMLDLMRAQLTPIREEANSASIPSIGATVFVNWVDMLNDNNLQLAIDCNRDAVLAAQRKDYDWFDNSTLSPPTANIMRTYYNKQVIPATPDWAQEFYERLYNKQSYAAWRNLMDLDKTLFEAAANCFSLMSGVYASAILDNISNKIFTE